MASEKHLRLLKQGVKAWNEWKNKNRQIRPNLSEADLRMADLTEADLSDADLSNANLVKAILNSAFIPEANLSGANLSGAIIHNARLDRANLSGANLSGANLNLATLEEGNLSGANLSGANLIEANFLGANLNNAILRRAYLVGANLSKADFSGADLSGAYLINANLVETNLENTNLTGCYVYGISAWNLIVNEETKQSGLIITQDHEPTVTVDDLEVAQFIYLLLNRKKLRNIIDTITTKVVLILGRFTAERKPVLDAIGDELRRRDYIPVLFDFDKPESRDTHETITTLARLARFVIADITEPKSIPQELVSIVETLPSLPIQPLLKEGCEPWGMFDHIKRYPWVLEIHPYKDLDDLLATLKERVVEPAQAKAKELQKG